MTHKIRTPGWHKEQQVESLIRQNPQYRFLRAGRVQRHGSACAASFFLNFHMLLGRNITLGGVPSLCEDHLLIRFSIDLSPDVANNMLEEHYPNRILGFPPQEFILLLIFYKRQKSI